MASSCAIESRKKDIETSVTVDLKSISSNSGISNQHRAVVGFIIDAAQQYEGKRHVADKPP